MNVLRRSYIQEPKYGLSSMPIPCYPFLKVANVVASNCNASYWHLLPPDISLGIVQLEEMAKLQVFVISFHFNEKISH